MASRRVEHASWIVTTFWALDQNLVVRHGKIRVLQNRLGFVVTLARRLAERAGDQPRARTLEEFEAVLERSRLAREDTLGKVSLPEADQGWRAEHRSPAARRGNVLGALTADAPLLSRT